MGKGTTTVLGFWVVAIKKKGTNYFPFVTCTLATAVLHYKSITKNYLLAQNSIISLESKNPYFVKKGLPWFCCSRVILCRVYNKPKNRKINKWILKIVITPSGQTKSQNRIFSWNNSVFDHSWYNGPKCRKLFSNKDFCFAWNTSIVKHKGKKLITKGRWSAPFTKRKPITSKNVEELVRLRTLG